MLIASLTGFGFGLVTAIPIAGPISALVFSQAMRGKYTQARFIALGASIVEAVYAFLAFWGFSRLVAEYAGMVLASRVLAAILLGALGFYFFFSKKMRQPVVSATEPKGSPRAVKSLSAFLTGAGVCAANPSLLATWGAMAATLYSLNWFQLTDPNAAAFSLGIAGGIFVWFVWLVRLVRKHRGKISERAMDWVLKLIGLALLALGVGFIVRALLEGASS